MTPRESYVRRTTISRLSQILILPLRLEYSGILNQDRRDDTLAPLKRLEWLANWVVETGQESWEHCPDLYQDLGLTAGASRDLDTDERDRYSTAVFFHPFIRDLLFSVDKHPIEVLRHRKVRRVRIRAEGGGSRGWPERSFAVRRAHLFLFPCDVVLFTLQVDFTASANEPHMNIAESQDLLNQFRRLYPPYFNRYDAPGQVPALVQWMDGADPPAAWGEPAQFARATFTDYVQANRTTPLANHWSAILQPLKQADAHNLKQAEERKLDAVFFSQLVDDRAPVMAFVLVDPVSGLTEGDYARYAFLDPPGTGMPYSRDFLGDWKDFRYDRFYSTDRRSGFTTRYLCAGYSFVTVASARDWFAVEHLGRHFERHYFFLGLLAVLHKAALLAFWNRLAELVREFHAAAPGEEVRRKHFDNVKWLLEDISDFVTRFYFTELSNQVQPLELFQLWSDRLGTPGLYRQVMEQAQFLRDVQWNHWQQSIQSLQARLQSLSTWWLPVVLALSFLGMGIGINQYDETWRRHLGPLPRALLAVVVVSAAAIVVFQLFNPGFHERMARGTRAGYRRIREAFLRNVGIGIGRQKWRTP